MTTPVSRREVPDWQLPQGVDRPLWNYFHHPAMGTSDADHLTNTPLVEFDVPFVLQHSSAGMNVVDLGCGAGRLSLAWARLGCQVTAVDLSPTMLAQLGQSAQSHGLEIQTVVNNLCDLKDLASHQFDRAGCLFSTLGMVVGADARQQALSAFRRVLKPTGQLMLHAHNVWANASMRGQRAWLLADRVKKWLGRPSAGDRVMSQYRQVAGVRLHLFSRGELHQALKKAGFDHIEFVPLDLVQGRALDNSWWKTPVQTLRTGGWMIRAY